MRLCRFSVLFFCFQLRHFAVIKKNLPMLKWDSECRFGFGFSFRFLFHRYRYFICPCHLKLSEDKDGRWFSPASFIYADNPEDLRSNWRESTIRHTRMGTSRRSMPFCVVPTILYFDSIWFMNFNFIIIILYKYNFNILILFMIIMDGIQITSLVEFIYEFYFVHYYYEISYF